MSNNATQAYTFTIDLVTGAVTAVYKLQNGIARREGMDRDETWTFDLVTGTVTKTELDDGRLETTIFSDVDGDGVFAKGAKTYSAAPGTPVVTPPGAGAQDGYQFTLDPVTNLITAVSEVKRGIARVETIDANETFSFDAASGTVTKTEVEYGLTETVVYADVDGNGVFSKVSKTYTSTNGAQTVTWDASHLGSDNDDRYNGGSRSDYYTGGLGNDLIQGNAGDDDLYGSDGDDALYGGAGGDDLFGGDGADAFFGGLGKDVLTGGDGNDIFKYTNVSDSGASVSTRDVIVDFTLGDKIDLSAIDAMAGYSRNDTFKYIGTSANLNLANANGAVWFENGVVYASTDRDLAAEFQIELVGVASLDATDLVL